MLVKEISLPKGSTQNCFISDDFPHFLRTFHNSLPSTSEKKINKSLSKTEFRWNFPLEAIGIVSMVTTARVPEAAVEISFAWGTEQSPLGARSTQGCMLFVFSRKDKWLPTETSRLPLCQRLGRMILRGLNWSRSSLTTVCLCVCFFISS